MFSKRFLTILCAVLSCGLPAIGEELTPTPLKDLWDTNTLYTASQVDAIINTNSPSGNYVPLVADISSTKTAVTIGSRSIGNIGVSSFANGRVVRASGSYSHAEGNATTATAAYSHAAGSNATASNMFSYVWQGAVATTQTDSYGSHGEGTYNIKPVGGVTGFYIGATNLYDWIGALAPAPGNYLAVSNAAMNALSMTDATNVVGSIVTNTVHTWRKITQSEWDMWGNPVYMGADTWEAEFVRSGAIGSASADGPEDATLLRFRDSAEIDVSYERRVYNALGLAMVADLDGKASTNDVHLTPVYGGNGERLGEWICSVSSGESLEAYVVKVGGYWQVHVNTVPPGDGTYYEVTDVGQAEIVFDGETDGGISFLCVATRTENPIIGYTLGSQTNIVLASTNLQTGVSAAAVTNIVYDIVTNSVSSWEFIVSGTYRNTSNYWVEIINDISGDIILVKEGSSGSIAQTQYVGQKYIDFGINWAYGPASRLAIKLITCNALGLATMDDLSCVDQKKQDVLPYPTNAIPYSVITNVPAQGRYPLFVIDLNPGEARRWQNIELKATTNNFENDGMTFFTGTTDNGIPNFSNITHDWCRVFIASKRADTDIRKWQRITCTGDLLGYAPLTLAIIVDPSSEFLRREASKADNAAWLYEGNTNLIWSYSRLDGNEHEQDQDGRQCWRMIMPTKWYAELPAWADVNPVSPDSTDIVDYVDPWLKDIEDANTTYQRFEVVTNINQSVQFVTNTPNNVLNIEMPIAPSSSTKDWVVYCNFDTETPLVLPAATWWMADASYTNAIPSNQPTALFFTQVSSGVFMLSRQELTSILIPPPPQQ